MRDNKILFIIGPPNSGTSSMVGMLNCHPDIFILYESDISRSLVGPYSNMLLNKYTDARYLFGYNENLNSSYYNFYLFFKQKVLIIKL